MYKPLDGTIIGGLFPVSFITPPRKNGRRTRSIFQCGRYRHNAFKKNIICDLETCCKTFEFTSILPQIQTNCMGKRHHRKAPLLYVLELPFSIQAHSKVGFKTTVPLIHPSSNSCKTNYYCALKQS